MHGNKLLNPDLTFETSSLTKMHFFFLAILDLLNDLDKK